MTNAVILDTTPLGLITQRPGRSPEADACRQWYADLNAYGWTVYLPEIADYEVRRELTRLGKTASLARLDLLTTTAIYLPLTTDTMRRASGLWAQARNGGWGTADRHALDGDVILAAQALTLTPVPTNLVVATGNVAHLSRYLPVREWAMITHEVPIFCSCPSSRRGRHPCLPFPFPVPALQMRLPCWEATIPLDKTSVRLL